tara:strand:+ start:388 stop:810 length:423 start_codon:yes stop_codon:yes gene_type:complete
MRENAIFTVTPPELMLPSSGPMVTIVSSNIKFVQTIETLYDNIFNTVSVVLYYPNGKITDKNLAWMLSVMRLSDTVYVDLDDLDELGIALVLTADTKNVYINEKNKKSGVVKILNSIGKQIFESVDDYSAFVIEGLDYDA